jgi:hypothetical protein
VYPVIVTGTPVFWVSINSTSLRGSNTYADRAVVALEAINGKPFALAVLHSPELKKGSNYDPDLCGKVQGGTIPSQIWIADLGNY